MVCLSTDSDVPTLTLGVTFQHCPQGEVHTKGKCWCDPNKNFGELSLPVVFLSRGLLRRADAFRSGVVFLSE